MNRIDLCRPDAPLGAFPGPHPVGVRTLAMLHRDQLDILACNNGARPRHDRALVVELWYPAATGTPKGGTYRNLLRCGTREVVLHGSACRDAEGAEAGQEFPLVILSHGFPGNRHLMAHLGEHLASHGFRVAAIDHTDSTYGEATYKSGKAFGSTLVNRPLDTAFVARELGGDYAIIGYSMGGYGALISAGAAAGLGGGDHRERGGPRARAVGAASAKRTGSGCG